jgi:thiol-disulfide isomerase/thioredoxin
MSNSNEKDFKVTESTENKEIEILEEEVDSPWYYFYTVGCGFCKRVEPIVDELIAQGHDILKLDLANSDNQALANELKQEYNVQCGTPWFINEATGKGICGYREKDVIEKWLAGEDIPAPPRPKSQPPRPPYHGASKKEEKKWIKEYDKWIEENSQLPNLQTAEQILERPRPKSEPPRPPMGPDTTNEQYNEWGKGWDEWVKENSHLPNLQPASQLIENFKKRNQMAAQQPQKPPMNQNSVNNVAMNNPKINSIEAKVQALELKVDKIIKHFGI